MQKIMKKSIADLPAFVTDYLGMVLALALLLVIFGLSARNFFTLTTFRTIANQVPDITIVAVGMTFVLIVAGIDLSVGSVMALASAVLGLFLVKFNFPLPAAIVVCLAVGILCGAANGLVIIRWRLPAFIVTLGMLEIARGGAYLVTESRTIYIGGPVEVITEVSILGLSLPFIISVAIVVVGQLVLSRTVFGRYLIAIGTNEEAVRLSGIDPRPLKLAVFVLCGFLTSIAAVIHTARLSSANPNAGYGLELQAIAAVVIGGTSLMGGRGSVVSSFFGVLIIAVLGTGLAQIGAQESTKRLITGCVIVAAVILDHYRHRIRPAPKRFVRRRRLQEREVTTMKTATTTKTTLVWIGAILLTLFAGYEVNANIRKLLVKSELTVLDTGGLMVSLGAVLLFLIGAVLCWRWLFRNSNRTAAIIVLVVLVTFLACFSGLTVILYGTAALRDKSVDPYFQGVVYYQKGDHDLAISDFTKVVEINPRYAMAYNNLAWLLATCPAAKYRDGHKAVENATRACELSQWATPKFLDTLSAGYAEVGEFKQAVKWQAKAIELTATENDKAAMQSRLKLYKTGKPYREEKDELK